MSTVLVVEDNLEIAELFQLVFQVYGRVRVIIAGSIREALMTASIHSPIDALIADFTLPDGIGPDLLHALGRRLPRVRLLITGWPTPDLRERYPGFDDYLTKPINCPNLVDSVIQLITSKPERRVGTHENSLGCG